jgi:hypothetical protein
MGPSAQGGPFFQEDPAMDAMTRGTGTAMSIAALLLLAALGSHPALAYTATIGTGPKAAYLRVGDGSITGGTYNGGGVPAANTTVNLVSVTVPAAVVGNTVDQAMTGTGRLTSDLDGFVFCNAGQVYVGGFFRLPTTANQSATVRISSPATLTTVDGQSIPMSQIRWTSSGNGDTGAQPFPAGTFAGGTQTLATLLRNTWAESCHSFFYGNDAIVAAGTYNARVTYTLATP